MNVRVRSAICMAVAVVWCGLCGGPVFGQATPPDAAAGAATPAYGYGLPPDVSANGHRVDSLIHVVHWFMGVLFVGWGIFLVYCLIRYRRRSGQKALYHDIKAKPAKFLEVGVVVVETVLLLGFSIPIWASVKNDIPPPEDNPLRIRVMGEQFAWNFHYPGEDGIFGKTSPAHIDEAMNPVGVDPSDPNGKDDIVSGEMRIPINRGIICDVASKDVIHSFSIPVMRVKQDVIPGMRIPVWFEARHTGTYQVACAQLCGNNHYKMLAPLVIQTPEEFQAWLEEKSAPAEVFDEDEF